MHEEQLLSITEAAKILGVSVDTLRRWDKSGKLSAIRKAGGLHRYYRRNDLEVMQSDIFAMASQWAVSNASIPDSYFCPNSGVFQARLTTFEKLLMDTPQYKELFSLIVAASGEIGNNSFDHNLGNWPDVVGIFFGYDISKGVAVLADRGIGVLATLRRVRPTLKDHHEALQVAFTEILSGRAPEERGNGLKFVRQIVSHNPINILFHSGDAELRIAKGASEIRITRSQWNIHGCLVKIEF